MLLLATLPLAAQTPQEIKPTGYVLDYAGVLSPFTRDALTSLCTNVDKLAQAQIAVVTVQSLGGEPIEEYSIDLATRLGVGPKASDRGVMILLAVGDRQYRIEVGYGLEAVLPDGKVGGFGREAIPFLRAKNYDAALLLLTRRVADTIAADHGVTLPATSDVPAAPPRNALGGHANIGGWISLLVFALFFGGLFVVPFLATLFGGSRRLGGWGRGFRGGNGSGWYGGPFIGGSGWGGMSGGGFGGGAGGGGFGGFGGGSFGGGGASGSW